MRKKFTIFLILSFVIGLTPINFSSAQDLSDKLSGKILLQVEGVGQAWYIDPETKERAFLGRPADAFKIMRELGLGISEDSYNSFNGYAPSRLSGKILLRVEANGEAYYIFPDDLKMHYLGRPADAFDVMREKGLGITDEDLNKVPVFEKYKEQIEENTSAIEKLENKIEEQQSKIDEIEETVNTDTSTSTDGCVADTWVCGTWYECSSAGQQTRVCNITYDCSNANTPSPVTSQNCSQPEPTPSPNPVYIGPVPTEISIQGQQCSLSQTNLKTDYYLYDLLQNGNIDGRIIMNAFVLNNLGTNYYSDNPPETMIITTSDHSNDKIIDGSGNTGPCGYHYPYEFYATEAGTYTVTYSVPSLNLSKTITATIKLPEKPIISSSGTTSFESTSMIEYWFQASDPESKYLTLFAQCSDADTPFSKVDMVSSLGTDGLYYSRGRFFSDGQFSGTTICKFINRPGASETIFSESDSITLNIE